MSTYASGRQVIDYLQGNPDLDLPPGVDEDGEAIPSSELERLIAASERDVDRLLGPIPMLATGRKLDAASLSAAQRAALSRATAAACEFRLAVGPEELTGETDYLSGELTMLRRASRPPGPRAAEELAGFGLVRRSGCALPDPPPLLP